MATIERSTIRNIGIAAHIDAGKTTTTERVLYYTGKTHRMGEVDDGTTITDFDSEEQQRGITIYSAAVTCPWKGYTIQLIDTPGHVDFTAEVERALRVLDGAVAVFDAKEGVEAQSETVWRQMTRYHLPRICFINKMDKIGADFFASFDSIAEHLDSRPVAVQIPIGEADTFEGLIDLVTMKAVHYQTQFQGARFEEADIPDHLRPIAETWRAKMIEAVAETCEDLMEKFFSDESIDETELRSALRAATIRNELQPVFCGSALKYIGVQRLLDGVTDYLPSPLDVPPVIGHAVDDPGKEIIRSCDPSEPFSALLFKIVAGKPVDLQFLRIYSGRLTTPARVLNATRGHKENMGRMYRVFAKKREQVEEVEAGDIIAVVGLKDVLTGDTLCDPRNPVILPHIEFAETVISMSIEPTSSADRENLEAALEALARQDPTFDVFVDRETGQKLISGMGELHLEVLINRLQRDMNVSVRVGKPRVSYRETITTAGEGEGEFIRQTGGREHFAKVRLRVEPLPAEHTREHFRFVDAAPAEALKKEYRRAVQVGAMEAARSGVVMGYPAMDIQVTLLNAQMHETDSSELAFESAARAACESAMRAAGPVMMEPIMGLELSIPPTFFGAVSGDLNKRRAVITHTENAPARQLIRAEVPLKEMFGYSKDVRSLTQGRADWTMEPLRYQVVPPAVTEEILASAY